MQRISWSVLLKSFYSVLLFWTVSPIISQYSDNYTRAGIYMILFVAVALIAGIEMPELSPKTWASNISEGTKLVLWIVLVFAILVGTRGFQQFEPGWTEWLFWLGVLSWACRGGIIWLFHSRKNAPAEDSGKTSCQKG